jgi:two-component system OmpR family sensor kinase/two-component system sensor histidine kinase BaeS
MNKLWIRLTLAFGLVIIIAIIVVAVLGNYQVNTQFQRFIAHSQMIESTLGPKLVDYYAQNNTWAGVETIFGNLRKPEGKGSGRGMGMMRFDRANFILIDATGHVVYNETERVYTQLSQREIGEAIPLKWQNQTIGYLAVEATPDQVTLTGPAEVFLSQTPRVLLQAGLIAGGLAVLMGIVIARGLSAPLGRLATAARRISRGELDQRVPVKGANEVADLAQAFNEMAANLEQAESLRRNLVADVAHELRTPLSVIQGNLRAILDDIYPLDKSEIAGIYDETLILSRLINDLRELAQAEAGQLGLNIQPTALPPLIEGAVDLFAELAREKEVNLKTTLPDNLPPVLADPDRVRQVLHNLLSNALRHTPDGGEIGISVEPSTDDPVSSVRVSVTDTGPGLPPEDLPHVFDRFWRADRSRSREHGGSGLGLAIARQLVQAQGGQIGVDSDGVPGQGSRFWFTLPVVR